MGSHICPVCLKRKVEPPALPEDVCDQCLEDDLAAAQVEEESREMHLLDAALKQRPRRSTDA